jgi:hypothetical protein
MGYLGFTAIVAASGACIAWLWHRGYRRGIEMRRSAGILAKNGLPETPAPPRIRTISGPSGAEVTRIHFVERMEAWQKALETRGKHYNNNTGALEGLRYTYVPRKRSGEPISNSA